MTINWKIFDEKIKNLKYPFVFIYNFFNSINKLDDTNASIMLRYIIKNNSDIFLKSPFFLLLVKLEKNKYHETCNILYNFYDLNKKRIKKIELLKKWYAIYKNKIFWKKNVDDQIVFLNNLKLKIQGIFDCSKGGTPFGFKIAPILKSNINNGRELTIESALERLKNVYSLFGFLFFKESGVPVITGEDFCNLNDDTMVQYINMVYQKSTHHISLIINLFEELNMINLNLHNLINPSFVKIEEDFNNSDIIEDLTDLF
jgi:hypothetical protein